MVKNDIIVLDFHSTKIPKNACCGVIGPTFFYFLFCFSFFTFLTLPSDDDYVSVFAFYIFHWNFFSIVRDVLRIRMELLIKF